MHEHTRLKHMILAHWQTHCPQMVDELRKNNHLEAAVSEAEENTADLLYELLSVQKMAYQEAWEMATREWAFLPDEDDRSSSESLNMSPKQNLPATSG